MSLFLILTINVFFLMNFNKFERLINIYDFPDSKLKLHKRKTPLLGGIIILINLSLLIFFQHSLTNDFLMIEGMFFSMREKLVLIFFLLTFFLIGLYDDKYKIYPSSRIILQIFICTIVMLIERDLVITKFSLSFYDNKIHLNEFSFFFTLFCIIIFTNALNFFDGINGQSCIFYLVIFFYLYFKGDHNYYYLFLIIILFFVLFLNFKQKLFLGDSGVYLISAVIIISLIFEHNVSRNIYYADEIFLLLILPGLDLVRLTLQRLIKNKNIFVGDREHLHHLLIKKTNLINANTILFILSVFPVSTLMLGLSFYKVFGLFLIIYFSLFFYLKKNKHQKRKP